MIIFYIVFPLVFDKVLCNEAELYPALNPDLNSLSGLTCYQCISDSLYNATPLCDGAYLRTLADYEKIPLIFQCPYNRKDFCVKIVLRRKNHCRTVRGCSNYTDLRGNYLKTGCTSISRFQYDVTTCLCDDNLCNSQINIRIARFSIVLAIFVSVDKTVFVDVYLRLVGFRRVFVY